MAQTYFVEDSRVKLGFASDSTHTPGVQLPDGRVAALASYDPASSVPMIANAALTVFINQIFGVKPGDDITAKMQALLNGLTTGTVLDIVFTVPGTYYINGAQQTGTVLSYTYSGSILLPAIAWDGLQNTVVRIRSVVPQSSGDPSTGDANGGVIFATTNNVAGGYMFAAVPYSTKWGYSWTGVTPYFENIIFQHPHDPQGGAVNAECCIRAGFDRVLCTQGALSGSSFPTGATEAIMGPQTKNNGDVFLRNVQVRGWGKGIRISEHFVLDNVDLSYCGVAFTSTGGGHVNWFGYVDVEECKTVFQVNGSGYTLIVNGSLDLENVATGTPFAPTVFADIPSSGSGMLGNIDLTCNGATVGGLGLTGSGTCKVQFQNTIESRPFLHPIDTMVRMQAIALPAGQAPGLTWPTLDAWKVRSGNFALDASGNLTNSNAGSSSAYLAARDGMIGGHSRRVQCTITLPASSYDFSLVANRQQPGALAACARVRSGNLEFGIGGAPVASPIKTISSAVTGSGTYTIALDLYIVGGVLMRVDMWLNGVLQYSHACTAAQQYTAAGGDPYLEDGIYIVDNGANVTKMTNFRVVPLAAPANVSSGTATLAAGTVTVANAAITANSIIRLTRQAAGAAPGHLSVTLTAGSGFTINSSSGTDTGSVFWEIVQA